MDLKRRVVEELRPSLLDHFGLPTAVRAYVESTCTKEGLSVEVDLVHGCESMSKDASIALFRIVQEGLANIIRHAHARTVKLQLHGDEHNCVLTLADDGRGFDADNAEFRWSHGLMGMRQRAEGLGGRLDIKSSVGVGTTLSVAVPLSRQ
jgi:signal transduction histidine kinase